MEKQITLSIPIEAAAEAKKALYEAVDRLAFVEKMLTGASTLKLPQAPEPKPEPEIVTETPVETPAENAPKEATKSAIEIGGEPLMVETRQAHSLTGASLPKVDIPLSSRLYMLISDMAKAIGVNRANVCRAIIQRELEKRPADFHYLWIPAGGTRGPSVKIAVPFVAFRELQNRAKIAGAPLTKYCRHVLAHGAKECVVVEKKLPAPPQFEPATRTQPILGAPFACGMTLCVGVLNAWRNRINRAYGKNRAGALLLSLLKKELREKPRDYKYPKVKKEGLSLNIHVSIELHAEVAYRARQNNMFIKHYTCDMIADILSRPENQHLFQQ